MWKSLILFEKSKWKFVYERDEDHWLKQNRLLKNLLNIKTYFNKPILNSSFILMTGHNLNCFRFSKVNKLIVITLGRIRRLVKLNL